MYVVFVPADFEIFTQHIVVDAVFGLRSYAHTILTSPKVTVFVPNVADCFVVLANSFTYGRSHLIIEHAPLPRRKLALARNRDASNS